MSGRPTRYNAAKMRHRCTIQSSVETQDDTGQVVVTWSDFLVNEPCQVMVLGGKESMRGRELEDTFRTTFRVHYRPGYNVKMRIVFQGNNYGITSIAKVEGLDRFLELQTVTT